MSPFYTAAGSKQKFVGFAFGCVEAGNEVLPLVGKPKRDMDFQFSRFFTVVELSRASY